MTPTAMIQGAADRCDEPTSSTHLEEYFARGAPDAVAQTIREHLRRFR